MDTERTIQFVYKHRKSTETHSAIGMKYMYIVLFEILASRIKILI